jgi:hypothetical protein
LVEQVRLAAIFSQRSLRIEEIVGQSCRLAIPVSLA